MRYFTKTNKHILYPLNYIKIFDSSSPTNEIRNYFKNKKRPFIIKKAVNSKIDLTFLSKKYKSENVLSLNPNSDKEHIKVSKLIQKIKSGQKYRLRANTKLGNKLIPYIDTSLINKLRENKKKNLITFYHMVRLQDKTPYF